MKRRLEAAATVTMPEDKKIIIDEDWKSRVEAEREEQRAREAGQADGGGQAARDAGRVPMPPASFEMLLTTLATEALVALGQIPHPATGKADLSLDHAKYLIDTLDVLQQKTKGNLTAAEAQALDDLLHQLRMTYVALGQRGGLAGQP
jgi:hypothetical protein